MQDDLAAEEHQVVLDGPVGLVEGHQVVPDWSVGLVAGYQVVSDGSVGLVVEWSQVVPDNQFDPQQDHKMVLADVQCWDQEDTAVAWVEKVGLAPQDHIPALVGTPVDL